MGNYMRWRIQDFAYRELVALCENIYFAKVADKNNEC